jgi:hypothetical protein
MNAVIIILAVLAVIACVTSLIVFSFMYVVAILLVKLTSKVY